MDIINQLMSFIKHINELILAHIAAKKIEDYDSKLNDRPNVLSKDSQPAAQVTKFSLLNNRFKIGTIVSIVGMLAFFFSGEPDHPLNELAPYSKDSVGHFTNNTKVDSNSGSITIINANQVTVNPPVGGNEQQNLIRVTSTEEVHVANNTANVKSARPVRAAKNTVATSLSAQNNLDVQVTLDEIFYHN